VLSKDVKKNREKGRSLCSKHRKQRQRGTLKEHFAPRRKKPYRDIKNKSGYLSNIRKMLIEHIGNENDVKTVLTALMTETKWGKQQAGEWNESQRSLDLLQDLKDNVAKLPKKSPIKSWLLGSLGKNYSSSEMASFWGCSREKINKSRSIEYDWLVHYKYPTLQEQPLGGNNDIYQQRDSLD